MADFDPWRRNEHDLGDDLRTHLTVIRGHAQLLLHRARQTAGSDPQFLISLAAIDGAVTAIDERLDRFETEDAFGRTGEPGVMFADS